MKASTKFFTCKQICKKYQVHNRYDVPENGYCSAQCEIYLKWEGSHCPCCGMKLRRRPRSNGSNSTVKYRERRGFKYQ